MEEGKTCQARGCTWAVVLCPELCSPHWWKIPGAERAAIVRAQAAGLRAGNHPNQHYQALISRAITLLDGDQGNLAVYEREPGDQSTRHSRETFCVQCQAVQVHHGVTRALTPYLVCSECMSWFPAFSPGGVAFPGMEVEL